MTNVLSLLLPLAAVLAGGWWVLPGCRRTKDYDDA